MSRIHKLLALGVLWILLLIIGSILLLPPCPCEASQKNPDYKAQENQALADMELDIQMLSCTLTRHQQFMLLQILEDAQQVSRAKSGQAYEQGILDAFNELVKAKILTWGDVGRFINGGLDDDTDSHEKSGRGEVVPSKVE